MHRGRALILAAALLGALALLFPFFSATTLGSISGRTATAVLPALLFVGGAFVAVSGDRGERLTGLSAIATAAAVATGIVATAALVIDAVLAARLTESQDVAAAVGIGLWLTSAAAVLAAIGLGVGLSRRLG